MEIFMFLNNAHLSPQRIEYLAYSTLDTGICKCFFIFFSLHIYNIFDFLWRFIFNEA